MSSDSQSGGGESLVRDKIKSLLSEIIDPRQMAYLDVSVHNLINLVRRNRELSDDLLQNLILRQIFNTCDKSKIGQTPSVSKRILNLLRIHSTDTFSA